MEIAANNSLKKHTDYMSSIGMAINQSKTEVTVFSRKQSIKAEIDVGIISTNTMKVLGVQFDSNLTWDSHINKTINRTTQKIKMIRHLRRWISKDEALKIVTSHYFGQTYYCSPVWMHDTLSYENWKRLRSQHYRALRAAIGDQKRTRPRQELDQLCKRATPRQWSYYISSKMAAKLYTSSDTRLAHDLRAAAYVNDRTPKRATFRDTSRLKIGRQQFKNRLQHMSMIKSDWIGNFSDDYLRQRLKSTLDISLYFIWF